MRGERLIDVGSIRRVTLIERSEILSGSEAFSDARVLVLLSHRWSFDASPGPRDGGGSAGISAVIGAARAGAKIAPA